MYVLRLFLLVLIVFSQISSASNIPLEEIPKLFQLHAFQSETDPNHYLILGNSEINSNAGKWYVLNWQNSKITSPTLKQNPFFSLGGDINFHFESGLWLYLPGSNSRPNAPGATLEVIPPGLIDPNRGREPLHSIPIDEKLIEQLGISNFVSPDFKNNQLKMTSNLKPHKHVAPNDNIVLLIVNFDQNDNKPNLIDSLMENFNEIIGTNREYTNGQYIYYLWTFERQATTIEAYIRENTIKPAITHWHSLEPNSKNLRSVDIKDFAELEPMKTLNKANTSFKTWEGMLHSDLLTQTPDKAAWNITDIINGLENLKQNISHAKYNLSNLFENSEAAQIKLALHFIAPLNQLISRGYALLDKMQTSFARNIFLFFGNDRVCRISYLNQPSGLGTKTYFQTWLSLLKKRIMWVQNASESERLKKTENFYSGPFLNEFKFINFVVKDLFTPDSVHSYEREISNHYPLLVFGLKDYPVYRAELAQFIIEMDKAAEYQRIHFPNEYDQKFVGSFTLINILKAIGYGPGHKDNTKEIPEFSRPLYYIQIMKVVTELLNTSRITITNSATYLAILDAAVSLQKKVIDEFGKVPNANSKSTELNELAEELLNSYQAVQVRMVRGLYLSPENCAGKLRAL